MSCLSRIFGGVVIVLGVGFSGRLMILWLMIVSFVEICVGVYKIFLGSVVIVLCLYWFVCE